MTKCEKLLARAINNPKDLSFGEFHWGTLRVFNRGDVATQTKDSGAEITDLLHQSNALS